MQVNDDMIDNLSKLACLEFSAAEKNQIKDDLERMIQFVQKLSELDLAGVTPLVHMSAAQDVYREDVVEGSCDRREVLNNAPSSNEQYFRVPKVIKNPSTQTQATLPLT
jgi:aspartyl-tRNA(Asn)/glutamyl-tRNA(Gln) amidotransferase subunit C